jgi:hypothetical protein
MTQAGTGFKQRFQQIAQHQIVGTDLAFVAPTLDKAGEFEQRGIDEMGHAGESAEHRAAPRGIGQVERNETRTERFSRGAAGHGDDILARCWVKCFSAA